MIVDDIIEETKHLRVLYVEDDDMTRGFTKVLFENFFNYIVVAKDGEDGLLKFKKEKFDIVFTDVEMPKMNGIEMAESIKEIDPNVDTIVLSAYDDKDYLIGAISAGISGYLFKPVELEAIYEVLEKIVAKRNLVENKKNIVTLKSGYSWSKEESALYRGGEMIKLTRSEIELFVLFTSNKNKVFSSQDIDYYLFPDDKYDNKRVRNLFYRLRSKLDADLFVSIYAKGYTLSY